MKYDHALEVAQSDTSSDTSSDNDMKHDHVKQADEIREEFETTNLSRDYNPQECHDARDMMYDRIQQPEEIVHEMPNGIDEEYETNNLTCNRELVAEKDDADGESYEETVRSDFQELYEEWDDNVVEDVNATESWFGGNSYLKAALVGRSNAFYWSDDDNGCKVELRELTNRKRVSNLLQSDFRTRLDQLMQSYVDRQDNAFESENGSAQDPEHQILDENTAGIDASPPVILQTHGDNDRQFPDFHEPLGTEREIINGLRIDMNTLQQKMNDMQKRLEACVHMQLELQRSVKQEVYSALNRLSNSRGTYEDGMLNCQSESSSGNGVCLLCCDDGFESLPDRSSMPMYICSKCAKKINWSKLKENITHP